MDWLWHQPKYDDADPDDVEVPTPNTSAAAEAILASACLAHYSTPGVIPPSSRLPSDLRELQRQPLRVWQLWKYGLALTVKATQMTGDVLAHTIWGPRRKSWGIEMTLITSFMRGAGHHAALFDLGFVRAIASIGGLMPLPSDALVTPVTFRVKSRHLRGILSELDMTETGERLLSGEWIVGKHTWHRLQSEWKTARTENWSKPAKKEQVVLYVHGGAYYVSSAAAQRLLTIPLAKHSDARVFALDYRLAPETRFPGPLHDVVSAYFRLVDDLHIPPENIVVAGDSAGGGLAVALLMYLRDNKYPLPSGGILMSPWVDLTLSCASWDTNADYDVVPIPDPNSHMNPITCYLGGNVDAYIAHPYASPLFGDFTGLPPLLVQCGDAEVLRDEITLLAHKARSAGVDVRLELYQDAVHIFQMFPFLDASRRAFESIGAFVREVLPQNMGALDLSAERSLEREIENSDTKVVRGDGVETATRVDSISISDSDRESSRSYASWRVRSSDKHRLPSPPSSEDDDDTELPDISDTSARTLADVLPGGSPRVLYRMAVRPELFHSGSTTSNAHRPPYFHHSLSFQASRARENSPVRIPTPANTPAPSPSIRSSASHPDITSLIRNWTDAGPSSHLNQALLYKQSNEI